MIISCILLCSESIKSPTLMVTAWSNNPNIRFAAQRTTTTNLEMKRGRGQIGKEVGFESTNNNNSDNTNSKGMGSKGSSSSGGQPVINWIPISASSNLLPTEENKVGIIDTNLPTMKNGQTNPTGAVSVIKYNDITYSFAINCPSCKIPLTKATVVESSNDSNGQPRLVCDLCKATYNIKTGEKLKSAVANPGIIGGLAKTLFSSQDTGNLKTYKLGERNGKLLIALD